MRLDSIDSTKLKKRTGVLLVLISSAFAAMSCGTSWTSASSAADAAAIQALDEQWSATAAKNDLEGTVAFYADDAVLLPPNAPIARDRKSIRESWAGLLGPNTAVAWKVSKVEVAKSGELGYLYGTYSLAIRDPKGGAPVSDTGKLVEIWKKQADGKVEVHCGYLQLRSARRPGTGSEEVRRGAIFRRS